MRGRQARFRLPSSWARLVEERRLDGEARRSVTNAQASLKLIAALRALLEGKPYTVAPVDFPRTD